MDHDAPVAERASQTARRPLSGPPFRVLSRDERLLAALVTLTLIGVAGIAWWLEPDPRGVGTHEQLGLRPCFLVAVCGVPCPFCGMTTAVTHAAHGNMAAAFRTQPAGALFALALVPALAVLVGATLAGRWPRALEFVPTSRWALAAGAVLLLAAWAYKIATFTP